MSIEMTAPETAPRLATAKDYFDLMKPRIMGSSFCVNISLHSISTLLLDIYFCPT